jgi:hypothetical protein
VAASDVAQLSCRWRTGVASVRPRSSTNTAACAHRALRVAGFDLFRAADGQVDRRFVLAKLKRAVAATFAPERTDSEPSCRACGIDDTACRATPHIARTPPSQAAGPARSAGTRAFAPEPLRPIPSGTHGIAPDHDLPHHHPT